MKITTWNVNSVRTRLAHVLDWLQANPVEVLCLQETKVTDDQFPRAALEAAGYQVYVSGQKSYNGVALISRSPLAEVAAGFGPVLGEATAASFDAQKRVITGVTAEGVRVVNLYVPNGSAIGSDKYDYKLRWLATLRSYLQALLAASPLICVCGDFNIAPTDRDIYDPVGRETHIMASDAERQALAAVLDLGFADAFRKFTAEGGHFSWWDYRAASFRRNQGWRIDHHYLTPALYEQAIACTIDRTPRQWEKPSDHAPVTVEFGSLSLDQ
ncbi:exodeoxyribonuclease III [Trichothermofontia sichuanensis B231]|uniref:exodeoxyribonuclease III n=1 Tax=Trichothermofontia sichuanensis TaxID=3045816 RepID=UPI0022476E28|nr:exodeoxyribonuclease III [Trichothermofontia sichuanensis]UZQ53563.1 exodeoxyribonuclease III [Trichothermofontia sichuanensis B231]